MKQTSKGVQLWGPAGAGVWSAPAVDLRRRAVYVATGNGYTQPAAEASDAVVAFDLDTGARLWTRQVMANDSYVRDCPGRYRPNVPNDNKSETCPDDLGPDMDFGNAPMLRTLPGGRSLIVIGQKDGHAWALDPDKKGEVVWSLQVGRGSKTAAARSCGVRPPTTTWAYFLVTRTAACPRAGGSAPRDRRAGMARVATGWGAAPVTVIPGVVFVGSSAGTVYAYSTADGKALWQYDTAREFETVNGVPGQWRKHELRGTGRGDGMVFVPSGYWISGTACAGTSSSPSGRSKGDWPHTRTERSTMIRTRLTVTVIAAITCVTTFLSVATASAQAPRRVALVGGMLLTGYEVPPIHHAAILIEGDKIVAAGPTSEIEDSGRRHGHRHERPDMLPGLIETHGHLVVLGHGSYDTWFPWINSHGGEAMLTRVMEIAARQLLMAGVTTTSTSARR